MTIFIIDMTLAVSNLLLKSLLTSPAYRQAGFPKGGDRSFPLWQSSFSRRKAKGDKAL